METIGGQSPSAAGFTIMGGGRSVRNYIIGDDGQSGAAAHPPVTDTVELFDAIVELMGETRVYDSSELHLSRTLPLADPIFQWMFCESIGSLSGRGRPTQTASNPLGILEAPTVDYAAFYPCWLFSGVNFTQRPYAVISDSSIPEDEVEWVTEDGFDGTNGYAEEWLRFVDVEDIPAGEYITAQAGQFIFDVNSSLAPNSRPAGVGQLRMLLKRRMIKMTWFQVPYNYIDLGPFATTPDDESWIVRAIGKVNQRDWWLYPKGTMLLEGIGVSRYTPVVPQVLSWRGGPFGGGVGFSNQKLCNITFFFSFFNPPLGKDSAGNPAEPSIPIREIQDVTRGWNLVPYAHMGGFYYVKTKALSGFSDASNRPIYQSFPMELCFTNPGITL